MQLCTGLVKGVMQWQKDGAAFSYLLAVRSVDTYTSWNSALSSMYFATSCNAQVVLMHHTMCEVGRHPCMLQQGSVEGDCVPMMAPTHDPYLVWICAQQQSTSKTQHVSSQAVPHLKYRILPTTHLCVVEHAPAALIPGFPRQQLCTEHTGSKHK